MSEHAIQKAYFDWAHLHPVAKRAYAIPNGGARHKAVAAKLKAEGVRKGVLDVCLPVPRSEYHGLYIEFKFGSNTLSPEQIEECHRLTEDGYAVAVSWDAVMAIELTNDYLDGKFVSAFTVLKPARQSSAPRRQARPSS